MIVEQIPGIEIVKVYDSPTKFLEERNILDFNLCIMDIEMPKVNGLMVAEKLSDKMVIFVTAYSAYAADAFDLNVVDYVRKPLNKERLEHAIIKARTRFRDDETIRVAFNTDQGKYLLKPSEINYIVNSTIDSRDKDVYMQDGRTICVKNVTFARLEEVLPKNDFCRVNKREIVALHIVKSYTHNMILTTLKSDNSPLSFQLSSTYRARFIERLNR